MSNTEHTPYQRTSFNKVSCLMVPESDFAEMVQALIAASHELEDIHDLVDVSINSDPALPKIKTAIAKARGEA